MPDDAFPHLRAEVRAFLDEARTAGTYVPMCDGWLEGHDPSFSRELGRRGWLGMTWPRRYGGHERSSLDRFAVSEELLAAGAPVAAHWIADRQTGPLLLRFGSEEQRQRYLPRIAAGELYVAIGMSEPESGSDLASVRTRATPVEGGWKVTGTKVWTSHAHRSDIMVALVRTAPPGPDRHAGLSQMIIELAADGVSISPIKVMTGGSHFAEVSLDGVFVSDDMVVGEVGDGWHQVTSELAYERSGPERFLSTYPLLAELIDTASPDADADVGSVSAQLWVLHIMSEDVNRSIEAGTVDVSKPALVKDVGTRLEGAVTEVARKAYAGEARPSDVGNRLLRQAMLASPAFTLRGGTNEILRTIIARSWRADISDHGPVHELVTAILAGASGPDRDGGDRHAWGAMIDAGLTALTVPVSAGGSGGGVSDLAVVLRASGQAAVSVPIAEATLAAELLYETGASVPEGMLTVAVTDEPDSEVVEAPYGRYADHVVIVRPTGDGGATVAVGVPADGATGSQPNLAGEPRDRLALQGLVEIGALESWQAIQTRKAAYRALLLTGALAGVRDATVKYANEREQFNRPIAKFQAVQSMIVETIAMAELGRAITDRMVSEAAAVGWGDAVTPIVAAARAVTGSAATASARCAHQVHGAIGFTTEHPLHRLTTRLMAWRDQDGSDVGWTHWFGEYVRTQGSERLWDMVTAPPAQEPAA